MKADLQPGTSEKSFLSDGLVTQSGHRYSTLSLPRIDHDLAATQGSSMSVMEFILVAHSIIVGLAIAEILRGLGDLVRAEGTRVSYRLLLMAGWALLLLLQAWWAIWQVGDRHEWSFLEFLIFLLPVGILYVFARLCFPKEVSESNLRAYYLRVAPALFMLVATTYATFRYQAKAFHFFVIVAMIAQVGWRGLSTVVGS